MDLAKVYPYVTLSGNGEDQTELPAGMPEGMFLPLGHEVFAVPVYDLGDDFRNVQPDDLEEAGLNPADLHAEALYNLETLAQGPAIQKATHQVPDGYKVIVWSGHWLVASCLRLPRLYDFAAKTLETDRLCISIPQRELLFVFPEGTREQRDQMRAIILDNETDAKNPITWELFSLSANGLRPIVETPA